MCFSITACHLENSFSLLQYIVNNLVKSIFVIAFYSLYHECEPGNGTDDPSVEVQHADHCAFITFQFSHFKRVLKINKLLYKQGMSSLSNQRKIAYCQATTTSSSVFSFLIFNQTVQESTIFSLPNETRGSSCRQNMMRTQYQIPFNIYPWRVGNKYYCFDNVYWVPFHQIKP